MSEEIFLGFSEPEEKLKPCPFCGCEHIKLCSRKWPNPDWDYETQVYCANCGAMMSGFAHSEEKSEERAIKMWGTRV